jgi:1-deoxy-D-xylulose-5-phosphate synthase
MTILESINSPSDLKKLDGNDLVQLAVDIRDQIIKTISKNGGHLASSLGAVELTIALHRVFDSPRDKIIWDVGHQSYAHKLITGRRDRFETIRQYSGLSGFPSPEESPYDAFISGHAGNSISAALGMALARDLKKENYQVIAVIGDGSIGSGMAFEAINHTGHLGTKLIIVLNDNGMSISPSVGALARLLNQVRTDVRYSNAKRRVYRAVGHLPFGKSAWTLSLRMKKSVQRVILPNAFWEELGFTYLGPLDGHNIREIETALIRARDIDTSPTVIHVLTQKGKGYPQAEEDVVKYHGISPDATVKGLALQYNQILGGLLTRLMSENPKLVVISAAMLDGTGLSKVAADYPGRVFDVGICEQHAVTLAAGLASQGFIPVVAMYSTFLQRAYDQIIHDVCLPNLPVIFAVDRAGIVGEDGKTHHGPFDMSFLRCIPNMLIASPADENDLQNLFYSALSYRKPIAIRYPRGCGQGVALSSDYIEIKPGRGEIVRPGKDLTILAIGPVVYSAMAAARALALEGIDCAVVNARFSKPLDAELIRACLSRTPHILTVEENALTGGFGSAVTEFIRSQGLTARIQCLGLPDTFIEHGPQELLRSLYNIDAEGIAQTVRVNFAGLFPVAASREQEES